VQKKGVCLLTVTAVLTGLKVILVSWQKDYFNQTLRSNNIYWRKITNQQQDVHTSKILSSLRWRQSQLRSGRPVS
jgi:hypothetical protein